MRWYILIAIAASIIPLAHAQGDRFLHQLLKIDPQAFPPRKFGGTAQVRDDQLLFSLPG